MPYYEKSEDWLHQSALLLQARPSTTRITTRYRLKPARRLPKTKSDPSKPATATTSTTAQDATAQTQTKPSRGHLVLKTYDPASGVALKYKTSKAAEVTRLVQMLGTLGRRMAAVPVSEQERENEKKDAVMADVAAAEGEGGSGVATPVPTTAAAAGQDKGAGGGGGAGAGGKKKKKGKR